MSQDLKFRVGGIALVLIGFGLAWLFLLEPLDQARHGAAQVHYSLKAFFAVPACLLFGLGFALMGKNLRYRDEVEKTFTPIGWTLMGLTVLTSTVGFWWIQQQFAALGYH